jgi:hypothetical protein
MLWPAAKYYQSPAISDQSYTFSLRTDTALAGDSDGVPKNITVT